jgi:methylthioribose-1-phosphate isomerase
MRATLSAESVFWCVMRTIRWNEQLDHLEMIDQRLLPGEFKIISLSSYQDVATSIAEMVVRGAPAIGISAAFGIVLAARQSNAKILARMREDIHSAAELLRTTRPTAVNLVWALERMSDVADHFQGGTEDLKKRLLDEAQKMANEDVEINKRMALFGADLIEDGDTVIHHCNTGALATVDWGTALGVIRMAHEQGKNIHVLVDETRPRLQGARLTAWELEHYNISYEIISDNAAGYFMSTGQVKSVFVGADRVAANGDVANKIGTYMLALAAKDNAVPFYAVVPSSTIDLNLNTGQQIPIEERNPAEVLDIQRDGKRLSPQGAKARNPAFDVTPNRIVTAIITEFGVIKQPFKENIQDMINQVE